MAAETQAPQPPTAPLAAVEPHDAWPTRPLTARLKVLRAIRDLLAQQAEELADAIPSDLSRNRADTFAAELLPLLAACKFLEHEATNILVPRRLGRSGLPFWLSGVDATIERVPLGSILIIAPSNYPLFLPGVQTLQALAAGNTVVWKPGRGGAPVAQIFAAICSQAGLPPHALRITDDSVEPVATEIAAHPDKIVFTGSSAAGRIVQRLAAEASIPVVAELSACDAVFVLPTADPHRVADALCFGMRLNGSATCMAPRRLILIGQSHAELQTALQHRFSSMDPIFIRANVRIHLQSLLSDAEARGAHILGDLGDVSMKPILVANGSPAMNIANTDIFAPVLAVLHARDTDEAVAIDQQCSFGLTAAIFGDAAAAQALGARLNVGLVRINDLIVPTADPRIPFGGRAASGFGVTRGAEGLLDMTATKTTSIRNGNSRRHFEPTSQIHEGLFTGLAALTHRKNWLARFAGARKILAAVKHLK